jgi:hypothetical protein
MHKPLALTAEIKSFGQWVEIGIEDALVRKGRAMRCVECHGIVRPHEHARTNMTAHFEHHEANAGCSRSSAFDGGEKRMHRKTLT